jgi:uncharacterized phage protein (TIGR02220 family)
MPRKRMIDPTIWEDEHFGKLSDKAKILFISCISNADDDGRLSGNQANLRATAFRFEDISLKRIDELLNEIATSLKNFTVYSVNGCQYIQLQKWEEYQKQREERRHPSKYPTMSDSCQTNDGQMPAQVKLSKDKLSKDNIAFKENIDLVIADLNDVCKTSYKLSGTKTRDLIKARLNSGFTVADFQKVHRLKYAEWNNTDMEKYLRPETLYGTKFEGYLNQKNKPNIQVKYS